MSAYEAAKENVSSLRSMDRYTGKDEDGNEALIYFELFVYPAQKAMFIITEVRDA